ncbi:hypothetical protein DNTS_003808 [Danionella cerebrum]|uniref:Ubiquitin-like domain-containing protein n=1 Tax=Danionella cerebrum TaxID=2873325 RepID=A0A553MQH7_9TELE|nr:hypothetical protein DNTS_003808 [Danionella translucida]
METESAETSAAAEQTSEELVLKGTEADEDDDEDEYESTSDIREDLIRAAFLEQGSVGGIRDQEVIINQTGSETKIISTASSTATVKIQLIPDKQTVTVAFTIGLTVLDLKKYLSSELRVPQEIIQITLDDKTVDEDQTLMDIGVQPHGMIQFEMSSLDPVNYPIKPLKPLQEYNMPDVITVRVHTDAAIHQDVVVEIERATQRKPYLGGFRNNVTKVEYHHAAVQTKPKRRQNRGVEMFSRDSQTVALKNQSQQCLKNAATQMRKIGCYVSDMEDKLLIPGSYITADQYHSTRLGAVIIIQSYVRRWLAKSFTQSLRQAKELRLAWLEAEKRRKREEKEQQIRDEYHRRMNPETKGDFDLLYNALKKWRSEEEEHINCAEPKKWRAFDGKITEMNTQFTLRARELRDLYNSITQTQLTKDERLDVLVTLKHTVREHECKLTQEIVELIDREVDLMMRGVKKSKLEGLRKRISTLFLQLIKTPAFNPQVSKHLLVPLDPADLKKNIYLCRGCNEYQSSTSFSLMTNTSAVGLCHHCVKLDNEGRRREDLSLYRNLLRILRETEAKCAPEAKVTFLLQEQDLRYLVDVLWGAQSALSGSNDLSDLLLVRWMKTLDWTPWNCILLTKDEAAAHLNLMNIEEAYDATVTRNIVHKHTLARKYFSHVPEMSEYLHPQMNDLPISNSTKQIH